LSYSIQHIAQIINAATTPKDETLIEHLLLDSRRVYAPSASIFFALKGLRRDGHQFISELYKKGIRFFVISENIDTAAFPGAHFLLVNDTLAALQQLAAYHRKQFKTMPDGRQVPVIGITGSNGKTIVKEWLYQLLNEDFNIVRSPKSYNSQIGVPLSVWQMNAQHTLGIFEAGISQPGEMEKLEKIIQPTIGILTNMGEAHSEGFLNKRQKLEEKLKLFQKVSLLIYKDDGQSIKAAVQAAGIKSFSWGHHKECDIQIVSVEKSASEATITFVFRWLHTLKFSIPFTDEASIENAISSYCVLLHLNTSGDTIQKRMMNLQPVNMRLELKKGINNCSLINDSYSADLSSLNIALNFLDNQSAGAKKTVILSDFLQSGLQSEELYKKIAASLQNHGVNKVIGIGEKISALLPDALASSTIQEYFTGTDTFIQHYRFSQFKDETILVKGARIFEFEKIVQSLEQKLHQTVLEINLNALAHNLKQYQQRLKPSTKIMAMVKAFAYGSGGAEIAGVLQYHKADYLGVAYADEGVELRKAGITLPIMVMNPEENAFNAIVENNLEPEIYSFELLHAFDKFLQTEGLQQYPVHIEIETGMNRLGFSVNEIELLGHELLNSPSFKVQSCFSHLAASEEKEQDDFTKQQADKFQKAAEELQNKLGYTFIRHIANSAAAIRHPQLQMDMVRLGIGLYGVDSAGSGTLNLQTVATLKSTVAQLKKLKPGESVSYNRRGIVEKDSVIATIRIGYADGYPRRLGNGIGKIWVKARLPDGQGKLAPIIGTVCMDMIMIDVTAISGVAEGDDVIIFGNQLPVLQLAQWAGTIPYEIMTGVSQRVKRVYFEE
jgi:Alr-MurF fusion protein